MLSDPERDRLEKRDTLTSDIRAVNDYRVKKKLIKWLEDAPDAMAILQNMPSERLKDDLSDVDAYRLLTIARYIMAAKKFMAVSGDLGSPENWQAVGYDITRAADSTDTTRSMLIDEHIDELRRFVGPNNPVTEAAIALRLPKDSKFWDRYTQAEKEGVNLVREHERKYILERVEGGPRS